jgi:CheY-like chemotaxis protein
MSCRPILLVEDDPDIRAMIAQLLELEGYRVRVSANGVDGLQILRGLEGEERPGLILLDLMMPVMNGWQFRAEQACDPALEEIPVVVMSGDGQVTEKGPPVRAASFLRKPVDLDVLLDTVRRHVLR